MLCMIKFMSKQYLRRGTGHSSACNDSTYRALPRMHDTHTI